MYQSLSSAVRATAAVGTPIPTDDWDIKAVIAALAIVISLLWNWYNLRATQRLQVAISNNQLKQKIFEKFIFDPISSVLREYYTLIDKIDAAFLEESTSRNASLRKILQDQFNPLSMRLERELAMADSCSIVSRDDLCNTAIEFHDRIIQCFSTMRDDALTEEQISLGKHDAINEIKNLIAGIIEIQIEVSQQLVKRPCQ